MFAIPNDSNDGVCENQALPIVPQYLNGTHSFPLNRYDLIIQFIIKYISSCGLHGSCWKQIIYAINTIHLHQNSTNTNNSINEKVLNQTKIKSMTYPITPKTDIEINSHRLCSFWHSFYDSESNNKHIHKSHKNGTIYLYILNQFMLYLKDIHQISNQPLPFKFYLIDKRIQYKFASKQTDKSNKTDKIQMKMTSHGICFSCMKNRKEINFDDIYIRYNKFIKQTKCQTDNTHKSLNDILLSTCFICDIYIVSNIELRFRFIGMIFNEHNVEYDALKYSILEILGRVGIYGISQIDLIQELNMNSNNLLVNVIKDLENLGLIVSNNNCNCNYLWLAQYKNIKTNNSFISLQCQRYIDLGLNHQIYR
eukprot:455775_1